MIRDRRLARSIAAIAIPAVITNITTPILALSDVAILGHAGSAVLLAAIAVGGTMFNMLYWLFGFLRMGTSGLTAQTYGSAGNTRVVLYQALGLATGIGVAMIALQIPLEGLLLFLIEADEPAAALASAYFRICIWGAPASLGMSALTGWCVGMQNSRLPMWTSIFINLLNILLSVVLVFGVGMKIEGVALGTLTAQWAGFLLTLLLIGRRYGYRRVAVASCLKGFGRLFRINTDILLRTVCLVGVTVWFTRQGAAQGDVMLATNVLLLQFFTFFSFFMDGLAFAGEALVGKYFGRSDAVMLGRSVRYLLGAGGGVALLFTLVYAVGADMVCGWLTTDQRVVASAAEYSLWVASIPVMGFMAFSWDGIFIGLTATRSMLLSMAVATAVYFAVYFTAFPTMGNHGLWLAFVSYLLTRGIVLSICYRRRRIR